MNDDEDNVNINEPLHTPEEKEVTYTNTQQRNKKIKRNNIKKNESPIQPIHNNYTIDEAPELQTEADISDVDLPKNKMKFLIRNGTTAESILTMVCYSPVLMYLAVPYMGYHLGIIVSLFLCFLFLSAVFLSLLIVIRIMIEKKYSSYVSILEHVTQNKKILGLVINCLFCICYCVVTTLISSELSTSILSDIKDIAQLNTNVFISICLFFCELIIAITIQLTMFLIKKEKHYRYIKILQSIIILLCIISYMFILIFTNKTTSTHSNNNVIIQSSEGMRSKFFMNLTNPATFLIVVPLFNLVLFNQENLFNEATHLKAFTQKRGEVLIFKTLVVQGVIIGMLLLIGVFVPFGDDDNNIPSMLYIYRKQSGIFVLDFVYKCLFLLVSHIECGFIWKKIIESICNFTLKKVKYIYKVVICVFGSFIFNIGFLLFKGNYLLVYDEIFICLIGGICAAMICYFFPGWVYLKIMKDRIKIGNKKMIYGLICSMLILGGLSTIIGESLFVIKSVTSPS